MMIGIYGASGFIGQHLLRKLCLYEKVLGTYNSKKLPNLIAFNVTKDNPEIFDDCRVVVITGAITDMQVCVEKPENSRAVNVDGVERLVRYFVKNKIRVIFLSSNQVFSGDRGNYTEEDEPDPKTLYGKQKYEIEKLVQDLSGDCLILRLSKVYSTDENVYSLYSQIARQLRDGVIVNAAYNQVYNPTEINYLCDMIWLAIKYDLKGIYHLCALQAMSRFQFARAIACKINIDENNVVSINLLDLPLKEYPPLRGAMRNYKIGYKMSRCSAIADLPHEYLL